MLARSKLNSSETVSKVIKESEFMKKIMWLLMSQ